MEFYRKSIEAVARELSTDLDGGLSLETARDRLKEYGPNVIPLVKGDSAIVIFLKQLFNPLMGVLMIGMVTSFVIAYYKEAFVIGLALLLTAIIGFIQEWKAARDIALLKSYEIDYAKVRRDGIIYSIPISEVVPGDILLLEQGMKVAADVRLVRVNDLCTQEALLTGESQPITKDTAVITEAAVVGDQKNMAYAGTFIAGGEGEGVVVATGRKTYLGSLSHLLGATERPRTPLQHQMERLSWWLGILFCLVTSVVMAIGYAHGISVLDLVITGIALAVAAIPESLPVAVTVILAIGVRRMVKRKALVRHLVAAETLGNVSVICADKTGTLTQGKMQVVRLASLDQSIALEQQKSPALTDATRLLLAAAVLNTDVAIDPDSGDVVGSPTEVSLVECARHVAVDSAAFGIGTQHKEEIPFSSDKKLKATLHDAAQSTYTLIVKGAPENVFALCEQDAFCASLRDQVNRFTMDGLRLLAVAIKRDVTTPIEKELHNMQCLGIIGFYDPLRETAAKTIEQLENAGITLVMVTGDHKETAVSVAKKAGLIAETNAVMTGAELSSISDAQLSHKIEQIAVFSRVDPADKIRIVNAWRAHGKSVAMIGDGVNDAPALKASNIGVAVGSGADVTHDIADMILLDDNLATIERAEGYF